MDIILIINRCLFLATMSWSCCRWNYYTPSSFGWPDLSLFFSSHLKYPLIPMVPLALVADSRVEWMNEWIYSLDGKISQSVKQEHPGTITACAYRCPESTIIQLWGTVDKFLVKTQHYENKNCLVIKRTKTRTLNVTQRREKCWTIDTWPTKYNRIYSL